MPISGSVESANRQVGRGGFPYYVSPLGVILSTSLSPWESTNLIRCDIASHDYWKAYDPYDRLSPYEGALLGWGMVANLPHSAGRNFGAKRRYRCISCLMINRPIVSTEVVRAVSTQNGAPGAAEE